ncbi:MAG TPA: T9SS type A sorting domain-containing protein [Candidatus Krumholzibacteria bacterium]|nr:T9SS type A sorting domain-containing protein [Candidatus Krumholzibacteria bacterium]
MNARFILCLCVLSAIIRPVDSNAQWNPHGNTLSAALGTQTDPAAVSDGAGGAFVVWADNRSGTWDIYAHRVSGSGVLHWPVPQNGTAVRTGLNDQTDPQIISDGAGGAIIVWVHQGNNGKTDIYAQRLDETGDFQWGVDGVALCSAQHDQHSPAVVSDGAGGAIVTWQDLRSDGSNMEADIYVRRINSGGTPQWTSDGVPICTAVNAQTAPQLVEDGLGGAIITWSDQRTEVVQTDIYAQRVNSAGSVQWSVDGVALCTASDSQNAVAITTDGAGGAIATWTDNRTAVTDIYAQRVNPSGVIQWTVNGVAVCAAFESQVEPAIIPDGKGGAIVTWSDSRLFGPLEYDVYAQRLNSGGASLWAPNGNYVTAVAGAESQIRPIPDGAGGVVMTWIDRRGIDYDIYAQRLSAGGTAQWTANGVSLCVTTFDQIHPAIVPDGFGGAIVAWSDYRNGLPDIYANRVSAGGGIPTGVGKTPAMPLMVGNIYPNPFSVATSIEITLGEEANVNVEVFDVAGRRVRAMNIGRMSAGTTPLAFDGRDERGHRLPSGVYFYRIHAGSESLTRKLVIQR